MVFKGSGFYRNDSRSDARGGSSERKSDTADSGVKAEKSADSSDSSKATKTETKSEPAAKSRRQQAEVGLRRSGSSSRSSEGQQQRRLAALAGWSYPPVVPLLCGEGVGSR